MTPRRIRLGTLLASVNVLLLVVAVSGVAFLAVHLLQQLADEQALARVSQAASSAQKAIDGTGDDLLISAQVLAERPTLSRYVATRDTASLSTYLDQYRVSSHLDGVAVLEGGAVLVASGAALSWQAPRISAGQSSTRFLERTRIGGPLALGALAASPSQPAVTIGVGILLTDTFANALSAQVTLPVHVLDRQAALADPSDPRAAPRQRALVAGTLATARLDGLSLYVAVLPLRAPNGDIAGVIETTLPARGIAASVEQLVRTLLVLALVLAVVSAAVSFLVGRHLGAPLRRLTLASGRIGAGDLMTPVSPAAGAEIGELASGLEDMRLRLLRLTGNLTRQQAEESAILTGIAEGVFTVDHERRIRYLNPQAASLLGVAPADAIGRFCGDVLNPQPVNGARPCEEHCPIIHARAQGGARATEHLRLASGARRSLVVTSAAASEDAEQRQVQVLRDETDVEVAQRLRDAVLANISHEFKTPLAAQLASIELLLDQLPDLTLEETSELISALQRGTLRLTQLIDNLLESVRIEAGKDAARQHSVRLEAVIEEAVELTRPLLAQREQRIDIALPDALPAVRGDAPRLTQVFVNLLANANKFAPAKSVVRIGGSVTSDAITLWVEDEGPGLPEVTGEALFERFVRVSSAEPAQGGMGLGLWIVKSIIERHGGSVETRPADGGGTRIGVTLPAERIGVEMGVQA
jgi:signal transduction histidine kinase